MTKRKSRNNFFTDYGNFLILLIGMAAFSMIFLPAFSYRISGIEISGTEAVFGKKSTFGDIYKFNILSLIGFGLAFLGGVLALFNRKKTYYIAALFFLASCIMTILFKEIFMFANDYDSSFKDIFEISAWPIVAAVLAGIGFLGSLFNSTLVRK